MSRGALSLFPLLCWGVLDNVLPLYRPEWAELWGPLELVHELDLLVVETLVSFSLGTFPQLLFQGVSPVCRSCSLTIACWSCALILGSSSGFLMGLVWAEGSPLPLPPLPDCWSLQGVVARSYHPLCQMNQYRIVGWCFNLCSRDSGT